MTVLEPLFFYNLQLKHLHFYIQREIHTNNIYISFVLIFIDIVKYFAFSVIMRKYIERRFAEVKENVMQLINESHSDVQRLQHLLDYGTSQSESSELK